MKIMLEHGIREECCYFVVPWIGRPIFVHGILKYRISSITSSPQIENALD